FRSEAIEDLAMLTKRIEGSLDLDCTFIAHQARTPELFPFGAAPEADDHCFHEFFDLESCSDQPNDRWNRSIEEFVVELAGVRRTGWRAFDVAARERRP